MNNSLGGAELGVTWLIRTFWRSDHGTLTRTCYLFTLVDDGCRFQFAEMVEITDVIPLYERITVLS